MGQPSNTSKMFGPTHRSNRWISPPRQSNGGSLMSDGSQQRWWAFVCVWGVRGGSVMLRVNGLRTSTSAPVAPIFVAIRGPWGRLRLNIRRPPARTVRRRRLAVRRKACLGCAFRKPPDIRRSARCDGALPRGRLISQGPPIVCGGSVFGPGVQRSLSASTKAPARTFVGSFLHCPPAVVGPTAVPTLPSLRSRGERR